MAPFRHTATPPSPAWSIRVRTSRGGLAVTKATVRPRSWAARMAERARGEIDLSSLSRVPSRSVAISRKRAMSRPKRFRHYGQWKLDRYFMSQPLLLPRVPDRPDIGRHIL